jgi:hypothetical protein
VAVVVTTMTTTAAPSIPTLAFVTWKRLPELLYNHTTCCSTRLGSVVAARVMILEKTSKTE